MWSVTTGNRNRFNLHFFYFFNQQKPNGRLHRPTHPLSLLLPPAGWSVSVARFGERERERVSAELNLQRWVCYPRNWRATRVAYLATLFPLGWVHCARDWAVFGVWKCSDWRDTARHVRSRLTWIDWTLDGIRGCACFNNAMLVAEN
jgi:hypothetical protein